MDFIHTREYLNGGDTIVIKVTHKCTVRVMDDGNFQKYRNGLKHEFVGGDYTKSPIHIKVPHLGNWNITLDLGGKIASGIKYSISYMKRP